MANEAAFELKDSYDSETFAGSTAVGDKTLDVKGRLEEGGGTIITDDPNEIRALDGYPALKRTAITEAKEARSAPKRSKKDAEPEEANE